jgi:hypothetical protein
MKPSANTVAARSAGRGILRNLIRNAIDLRGRVDRDIDELVGCSGEPQAAGCSGVQGTGITFAPWLTKPVNPSDQDDDRREER